MMSFLTLLLLLCKLVCSMNVPQFMELLNAKIVLKDMLKETHSQNAALIEAKPTGDDLSVMITRYNNSLFSMKSILEEILNNEIIVGLFKKGLRGGSKGMPAGTMIYFDNASLFLCHKKNGNAASVEATVCPGCQYATTIDDTM